MVRINLLPVEIIEKRKYERWYPYVFLVTGIIIAVVLAAWLVTQILVAGRVEQLQQTQETVRSLEAEAQALLPFQQQREQLEARKRVADTALTGRIDMGRLHEEISTILPDSVWATKLRAHEIDGLEMEGRTPSSDDNEIDTSYKSIAGTLVRLDAIDNLQDVWLTLAEGSSFDGYQGDDAKGTLETIEFTVEAKISLPPTATANTAVPAPPTKAGE